MTAKETAHDEAEERREDQQAERSWSASPCSAGDDCPQCDNSGRLMPNGDQCEWCYREPNSKFNKQNKSGQPCATSAERK